MRCCLSFSLSTLVLSFPEGFGLGAVLTVFVTVSGLELKLLALDADGGAGGEGVGDEPVSYTQLTLPTINSV